jgi:hypothetical protein
VPALLRRWFAHRHFHNFETLDLAIRYQPSRRPITFKP